MFRIQHRYLIIFVEIFCKQWIDPRFKLIIMIKSWNLTYTCQIRYKTRKIYVQPTFFNKNWSNSSTIIVVKPNRSWSGQIEKYTTHRAPFARRNTQRTAHDRTLCNRKEYIERRSEVLNFSSPFLQITSNTCETRSLKVIRTVSSFFPNPIIWTATKDQKTNLDRF